MSIEEEDVYIELREHLDKLPIGLPATESGVELRILKYIFSPEEARIALNMNFIPEPVRKIHRKVKKLGYTIEELEQKLKEMHDKGAIQREKVIRNEKEILVYGTMPLAVGMYEYQLHRLTPEFIKDIEEYFEGEYLDEALSTKINQVRTIPVEASLTPEHKLSTYEDVRNLIENEIFTEGLISVMPCICRKGKDLLNDPCKCTELRNTCFAFRSSALHAVEKNWGKLISKEEALDLLKKVEDAGLVLQPSNSQRPSFICCCCGCCCVLLSNLKKIERPWEIYATNHYAELDPESCIECGVCIERCQMEAIQETDAAPSLNQELCIGCGVCVVSCPQEAIALKRKEDEHIPPKNTEHLYRTILERKIELRKQEEER